MELNDFEKELRERAAAKMNSEQVRTYNQQPEVQERGVKLVETKKDNFKNILLGILGLAVVCLAVLTYLAYQGDLKLTGDIVIPECPAQVACPPAPVVNIPACPQCPANSCNVNFTCPSLNNITVRLVNST